MSAKDCEYPGGEAAPMTVEESTVTMEIPVEDRYVIADRPCPPDCVLDPKYMINWYNMYSNTLGEIEARIMLLLEDKNPVYVVCIAYQTLVHEHLLHEIYESIQRIQVKANASGRHKFSPAGCMFVPDQHRSWDIFAQFNTWVRQLAADNKMQPLMLHKQLLEKQKSTNVLCVNPQLYVEFLSRSSLGSSLTRDGLRKVINPLVKHITIGMKCENPLTPKADPACLVPTPPGLTMKYLKSPSIVEHLRGLGLFVDHQQKKGASRSLSRTRPEARNKRRRLAPPTTNTPVKAPAVRTDEAHHSAQGSSTASSSGYSSRSSRSSVSRRLSEAGAAAIAEDRKDNDLADCVFYNALNDVGAGESTTEVTDQKEKYMKIWSAYGAILSENHQLKVDLRTLNSQLTELQRFKQEALKAKDKDLEKELATYIYYDKCNERHIRILNQKLRDSSRQYRELSEQNHELLTDYYELRDERDHERREKEDVIESRRHLEDLYDRLVEDTKEQDKGERRKKKKSKKGKTRTEDSN